MGGVLYDDDNRSKQLMNILIKNGLPYRFLKETDEVVLFINDNQDIITLWKK